MAISEELGQFLASFISTIRSESMEWQKRNQAELLKMEEEKAIAQQRIKQQIEEMEERFQEHKQRVILEEKHHTRQFGEFLDSIDEMKLEILAQYKQMPKPVALMIHHHATELLTEAWHSPDARERLKKQNKFTALMLTISKDLSEIEENSSERRQLPEKTLDFINKEL